jgi:hypothetical protein
VLSSVNSSAKTSHALNATTREEQLKPFNKEATLGKRNYCIIRADGKKDELEFVILAENEKRGEDSIEYPLLVPSLK